MKHPFCTCSVHSSFTSSIPLFFLVVNIVNICSGLSRLSSAVTIDPFDIVLGVEGVNVDGRTYPKSRLLQGGPYYENSANLEELVDLTRSAEAHWTAHGLEEQLQDSARRTTHIESVVLLQLCRQFYLAAEISTNPVEICKTPTYVPVPPAAAATEELDTLPTIIALSFPKAVNSFIRPPHAALPEVLESLITWIDIESAIPSLQTDPYGGFNFD
jgi:hypothetical protein